MRTVALGLLTVECVVLVLWATEQGSTAGPAGALRAGISVWLAAHHTGIEIHGGHLGVTPYGLTALPVVLLWRGGAALVRERVIRGPRQVAQTTAAVAGIYATTNTILCFLAQQPGAKPIPGQALVGSAAIAAVAFAAGAFRTDSWRPDVPVRLGVVLRGAGAGCTAILAAAAVIAALTLVIHHHAITSTGHAVAPSASGTLALAIVDLLVLPIVLIWTASVLLGPGFGVGVHTNVGIGGASYGPIPGLPILGALPGTGGFSWAALLLLTIPVGAGVWVGLRTCRGTHRPAELVIRALQAAAFAGFAFAILAWLADGPIGPGRLSVAGPSPWQVGLTAFVEIGGGALTVAGVKALRWRLGR